MNELSIIIKAKQQRANGYLTALAPIIAEFQPEIIVIANDIDSLKPNAKYTVVRFSENYSQLKTYYLATTAGKKVMVIEEGLILDKSTIDYVLDYLRSNTYFNLLLKLKSYISSDKSLSIYREKVLVYNRGVCGFNIIYEHIVDDFGLLLLNQECVNKNIYTFIECHQYTELLSWYKNYILIASKDIIDNFHNKLEYYKFTFISEDCRTLKLFPELNRLFVDSRIRNNYINYLKILNKLNNANNNSSKILAMLKNIDIAPSELYFSWLLKQVILHSTVARKPIRKKAASIADLPVMKLFSAYEANISEIFIRYLLNTDLDAAQYIYDFAKEVDIENLYPPQEPDSDGITMSQDLKTFVHLLVTCIDCMKDCSDSSNKKKILLGLFDKYIEASSCCEYEKPNVPYMYISEDRVSSPYNSIETIHSLIPRFVSAKKSIADYSFEDGMQLLQSIGNSCADMLPLTRYYMQKVRFENNYYKYILSICMMVRNEEKNLERCLQSLEPLISSGLAELIIVDTGSTDRTLEIAAKYTQKVYIHPWTGNFADSRNKSILYADAEYIFIVDADEEFTPESIRQIIKVFTSDDYNKSNTFTLKILSYTDAELTQYAVMAQPRIFKNDGLFYYSSAVHNQPVCNGPINNIDADIIHYGYIMTEDIKEVKFQRTATLLKKELEKNPCNLYFRFQLSSSYAMHGDLKDALRQVEIYMRLIAEQPNQHDVILMYYNNAATIYINGHDYEKAEKASDLALAIEPNFIDFLYYKAYILFEKEDYSNSLVYINKYLLVISEYYELEIMNDGRFAFYTLCSLEEVKRLCVAANYRLGMYNECIDNTYFIQDEKMLQNCLYDFISACLITNRYSDLNELYRRISEWENTSLEKTFIFILEDKLSHCSTERYKEISASIFPIILPVLSLKKKKLISFSTDMIDIYNWDYMYFDDLITYLTILIPEFINFDARYCNDTLELQRYKKSSQIILHRATDIIGDYLTIDELIDIFDKYMFLCSKITALGHVNLLEIRERAMITKVLNAYNELKINNLKLAEEFFNDAEMEYHEMSGMLTLSKAILLNKPSIYLPSEENISDAKNSYTAKLKKQINMLGNEVCPSEILAVFDKYNQLEYYDVELLALKSAALIADDKLEEAQALLQDSLKVYPYDTALQLQLCNLYSIQQQYKKTIEAYCRIKLIIPDYCLKINQLVPEHVLKTHVSKLSILHGTMDTGTRMVELVDSLTARGLSATSINYLPAPKNNSPLLNRFSDTSSAHYQMDINSFETGDKIVERTLDIASLLIPEYDIFHFHSGSTLTFDHFDLVALKDLNKKMFMHFWGQDVRTSEIATKLSPYSQINDSNDHAIFEKLSILSRFISSCFVSDYEVYEYVKNYFEKIYVIKPMIDISKYVPTHRTISSKKEFKIIHAPSSQDVKGTNFVIEAIDSLKERYKIDFKIIQGVSHAKALQLYNDADLIIDQLLIGSYGQLSLEAMALEKPVMCCISDFMKDKYPKSLPLISANPENIESKLKYILENRDMLDDLGVKGRKYVEKYHDANKEIDKLISIYYGL